MTTITKVKGRGFKALNFESDLSEKQILAGKNGSGKTARIQAMQLLTLGYIPGTGKKYDMIWNAFGSPNHGKFSVSIVVDGVEIEKQFTYSKSGKVSLLNRINKRKAGKDEFTSMVSSKGLRVVDVDEFLSLSSAKKTEFLFEMIPPTDDYYDLCRKVEELKQQKKDVSRKYKEVEAVVNNLEVTLAQMDVPERNLGNIREEIKNTESQVKNVQEQISHIEWEAKKAEEDRRKEQERIKREQEEQDRKRKEQENQEGSTGDNQEYVDVWSKKHFYDQPEEENIDNNQEYEFSGILSQDDNRIFKFEEGGNVYTREDVENMLQDVLEALSICDHCPARIVVKDKIKKNNGGQKI